MTKENKYLTIYDRVRTESYQAGDSEIKSHANAIFQIALEAKREGMIEGYEEAAVIAEEKSCKKLNCFYLIPKTIRETKEKI